MKSWSLRIGRYFGIDVFIHWTFWILIVWILLMHVGMDDAAAQGLWGVLFVLALFGCVVLHEFGHALTAKRFGVVTRDITIYPIGGISSFESMPEKPGQELLVGLAGPSVNIAIAIGLYIYLNATGQVPDITAISNSREMLRMPFLWNLYYANVVLAVFNLVPAFPMDGGRVFRGVLSFFMTRVTATRIAASVGQFLGIVFVFLGFFYNFWLVFIGLFVYLGAGGEAAYEQTRSRLAGLTVNDALMKRFTILRPDDTLDNAVEALLNSQETEFVVADAEEKPVGLLTRNLIIKGLSEKGKEASVSQYMNTDFLIVASDMKLEEFFRHVLEKGKSVALVMAGKDLLGLIDQANVEERLLVQEAAGSQHKAS
jgi:Zn-dependent protease/CBS domain-containing protein